MTPRFGHRTNPQRLKTSDRRLFVLRLRRAGTSYPEIARRVLAEFGDEVPKGYNAAYAYKDVKRELDRTREAITDEASEYLALEVIRLEEAERRLWAATWSDWADGNQGEVDLPTYDRLLRTMERKAKLLGLDGPSKLALMHSRGQGAVPELTHAERARALAGFMQELERADAERRNDGRTHGGDTQEQQNEGG
jgi:hypothetical protein